MAMDHSYTNPSPWFHIFFIYCFLFTDIYISSASSSLLTTNPASYSQHCSSIVPESTSSFSTHKQLVPLIVTNYYTGGDRLLAKQQSNRNLSSYHVGNYLRFPNDPYYYETQAKGIYRVQDYLYIQSPYRYFRHARRNRTNGGSYIHGSKTQYSGSVTSLLGGFWSEDSRKLCMVGSAKWDYEGAKGLKLDVVFKLSYPSDNPTIYTSIVSGTFESTSSVDDFRYFDPISIFSFPVLSKYNYSLVTKELEGGLFGDAEIPKNQSLNLQPSRFCSMLSGKLAVFELEYAAECKTEKRCYILGGDGEFLPRFVSLNPIQCSRVERKLRYMITFQNTNYVTIDQPFDFNSTLIGEASWDEANNELFIVACRILDPAKHFGDALGDCTVRLSLRYPSIWNIRNDAKIVGQIWTNNSIDDSGYFRKIKFTSSNDNDVVVSQGLRYDYTELERVRKLCFVKRLVKKAGNTYPDGHSREMRFDMSVKTARGMKIAWGLATPLSVGNELYRGNYKLKREKTSNALLNISYKISISPFPQVDVSNWFPTINWSINLHGRVEITAEGVYDAETGLLCMVGCRKLLPYVAKTTNDSWDCEIIVSVKFAPLNNKIWGLIRGTIQSTRAKSDPLYFDNLSLSSAAFYESVAKKSIWRMDMEITMVLISNTLLCIFVGLQLFHVKRNPEVLSSISLVMLLILSLGHLIPLVLNFEAMFLRKSSEQILLLSSTGWLEANEEAVSVVTMVAFLLHIHLLQFVWTAKMSEGNENGIWLAEKKSLFISLPIYISGGLLAFILNQTRNSYSHHAVNYSLLKDLRSYAGLILDGFLLPQILLNAFHGSATKALSGPFYIGTSAVRLVPHAYDQYRAHNYPTRHVNRTYYYANPAADFYSIAWDIIIPCGVIALAVIVFLQQRHGGRCIFPRRFREVELYEMVPVSNNE